MVIPFDKYYLFMLFSPLFWKDWNLILIELNLVL